MPPKAVIAAGSAFSVAIITTMLVLYFLYSGDGGASGGNDTAVSCVTDTDCAADQICRLQHAGGECLWDLSRECVGKTGEAAACGGFVMPCFRNACADGLVCVTPDNPDGVEDGPPGVCQVQCPEGLPSELTTVRAYKAWMNGTFDIVFDTRTAVEYAGLGPSEGDLIGHIPGARLAESLHMNNTALVASLMPCRTASILLVCRSGRRSSIAQELLTELGFTCVYNLDGGTREWKAAGFPVATGTWPATEPVCPLAPP
eukprot:TRINITY_DN16080_c0_g1_i1.p1 TRINITY_DN16080_c0_g1~~TRINITY_DN16080_c0_g1_i1.p1  ORF type:complete len:258 (+),score=48.80 TRINITY_DN16080_c0_g1_i1:55-828(+)